MISLLGLTCLLLSFFFGILSVILYFYSKNKKINNLFYFSVYLVSISILFSFLSLLFAYIFSDFTNYNVFQNSHSSKPLLYKISGTWGNHEGSMLLWLLIMSFYNLFFSFNKKLDESIKKLTILIQTCLYLCFILFVIFTSNPFLVNAINAEEGMGLNPILQDPILAIHPPTLYVGYIGFSLILSLALSGLLLDKIDSKWINNTKNWTLFCWS